MDRGSFLLLSLMVKSDNSLNTLEKICLPSEQIEVSAIASLSSRRSANAVGIAAYCYNSQCGKLLPDAFYIHIYFGAAYP